MFCAFCGRQLRPDAQFCDRCSKPAVKQIINPPQPHEEAKASRRKAATPELVIVVLGMVLFIIALFGIALDRHKSSRTAANYAELSSKVPKAIIEVPTIALKKRAQVERIIGKPTHYRRADGANLFEDEADYPWGTLGYNHDSLVLIILKYSHRPQSYGEAFALLGLPSPNDPWVHPTLGTAIWNVSLRNSFRCCDGLVFNDIFIPGDRSEIHLDLLDRDAPSNWTNAECQMWTKFSGQALPDAARLRGDPLLWPIEAKPHKREVR